MKPSPHVLMCPPDYFGVEYEINPWMNRQRIVDHAVAVRQWLGLQTLLEQAGAAISCMVPVRGLPDLVFTANAGLIYGDMVIPSRFRHGERRSEEPHFGRWFSEHGFRVHLLKTRASFEGAGDALFCGDTLFAGYRIRSDVRAIQELGEVLGCRVVPLELVQPRYYHLDTCFCPVTSDTAIYYPQAFDDYGQRALRQWIPDLISVNSTEARRFACNAVVLGTTVVTGTDCPELHRQLHQRGYTAHETPLDEFIKAGGSAKCLTLRLDGEDSASWKELLVRPCRNDARAHDIATSYPASSELLRE